MKLTTMLTFIFIILKLTGKLTWRWIWVLSPYWISYLLLLVCKVLIDKEREDK